MIFYVIQRIFMYSFGLIGTDAEISVAACWGFFLRGGGDFAPNPHIIVPPPKLLSAPLSPVLRGKDRTNINNS